jgi:hypothetical protein
VNPGAELARTTRPEQGLPAHVEDEAVLDRVAALLDPHRPYATDGRPVQAAAVLTGSGEAPPDDLD